MDMSTILVRYAEIALKGKNQPQFVSRLIRNIRDALGLRDDQVISLISSRISLTPSQPPEIYVGLICGGRCEVIRRLDGGD